MSETLTCPMCGTQFVPHENGVCTACPLNGNCRLLACCPNCGYEVVNPRESRLARWAGRLVRGVKGTQAID